MVREQQSLSIHFARKATKEELRQFDHLWVNQDHTQAYATTQDEQLAHRFRYYRSYLRDSELGIWEHEVAWGEDTVKNALKVLDA